MSTTTTVSPYPIALDDLKAKIREEHDLYRKFQKKAHEAEKTSLEHAIACGRMLIELKKRVKHGHLNWELKQIGVKPRMASNYTRIALKSATVADLPCGTIKGALAHLTNEKRLAEDKPTPPPPIEVDIVTSTRPPQRGITVDAEIVEKDDHQEDDPAPLVIDGTRDDDECKPEPGVAMVYARTALDMLNKIPKKDPSRDKAIAMIEEWITNNPRKKGTNS